MTWPGHRSLGGLIGWLLNHSIFRDGAEAVVTRKGKMEKAEEIRASAGVFRSRFSLLFIGIILTLALRPFLESSFGARLLSGIFFSFILLACIYSISETRRAFGFALALALPAVCSIWLGTVLRGSSWQIAMAVLQVIFWSYTLKVILLHLLRTREVTGDTIIGAACVYFLIGLAWSFIFFVLESLSPGSFSFPASQKAFGFNVFIYFSFITLTTTGFGDITPVSTPARSLVILEAALGQLFVAITISMLVGNYLSRSSKGGSD